MVSSTTRSTLIGHEPIELRCRQAAICRFPLYRRNGLSQTGLGLTANAILFVQPMEFGWRQHDCHRLAVLDNRYGLVTGGLDQLTFDLAGIIQKPSH